MAAAEARAAWQRAANRCLVQEDAKRAPKLACCPPPVLPHHSSDGNAANLHWNLTSSNLPSDTHWWLQLQPNFGCQMTLAQDHLGCIGGEAVEIEKKTSEAGVQQFKTPSGYAPMSLKCRGNTKNYAHEDREFMDFKAFAPLFPMKPQKEYCEMNVPWEESNKPQPWWQVADADGLASLVAAKAMQSIVNNDLPRPTQTVQVHGEKLNHPRERDNYEQPFPSIAKELDPLHDTMVCSYCGVSSTETNSRDGGSCQPHQRNNIPGVGQDPYSSTNSTSGSKPTYQNASERATLLDALRHSQTRAREAEMAAKKAYDEKDHVIKLLFRQASHLFACKQWLKMLQLENICLQLRLKEQQIATMFPEFPWMMMKEKAAPAQDQKEGMRKRGRKPNRKGGLHKAAVFVVGVGIVGAGLLLGWTLGWLLPKL